MKKIFLIFPFFSLILNSCLGKNEVHPDSLSFGIWKTEENQPFEMNVRNTLESSIFKGTLKFNDSNFNVILYLAPFYKPGNIFIEVPNLLGISTHKEIYLNFLGSYDDPYDLTKCLHTKLKSSESSGIFFEEQEVLFNFHSYGDLRITEQNPFYLSNSNYFSEDGKINISTCLDIEYYFMGVDEEFKKDPSLVYIWENENTLSCYKIIGKQSEFDKDSWPLVFRGNYTCKDDGIDLTINEKNDESYEDFYSLKLNKNFDFSNAENLWPIW